MMETDTALHCSITYRGIVNASYTFYEKTAQLSDKAEQLILMAIVNEISLIILLYDIIL